MHTEEAREFLRTHGGSVEYFDTYIGFQRVGQAFCNSLSRRHRDIIQNQQGVDPFYLDENLPRAIEALVQQDLLDEAYDRKQAGNND